MLDLSKLDRVQMAFTAWSTTVPESCHCRAHFELGINRHNKEAFLPKPDHAVCPREKLWRDYVRIRDGRR